MSGPHATLGRLDARRLNTWRTWRLPAAAGLVAAAVAVTADAWSDIVRNAASDQEASHVFLVPVVVGWLFWVRRRRLRHCRPTRSVAGSLIALAGGVLYSAGDTYSVQAFWHGGAVLVAAGALVTVFGLDLLTNFLPCFAALAFLVPVPGMVRQQVSVPLQFRVTEIAATLFHLMGVPVERAGNLLTINGVDVQIVEACNGLRMVFALGLVSYAFAFGVPLRGAARAVVLCAAPVSAVACNVARLVPTVWMYGHFSPTVAEAFHDASAWLMLLLSFLILLGLLRLMRWALFPVTRLTLAYD